MIKKSYPITLAYQFDPDRKNAKYTLDGVHYMNHGEFCEVLAKDALGYEAKKDANTAFNMGADIPELNASVKSARCGLTDMKLGNDPEIWWNRFWTMADPEQIAIWVDDHGEEVDLWFMSHEEFKEFCTEFAKWDNYCTKYRITTCASKINKWLEEKIENRG